MARPDDAAIRFPCPQCFGRLKATAAQAGTQRRCPVCQWVCEVPTSSRAMKPQESYVVDESTGPAAGADKTYISITCPVCSARMYAELDMVGQEVTCPDCDTPTVVPAPQEVDRTVGQAAVAVEPGEGYALTDEVDVGRSADVEYFPLTCPRCDTLIKATRAQIGEEIVCPDCQVPMTVSAPPEKPSRRTPTTEQGDEYAVREEAAGATDASAAPQPALVAVVCSRCETRLHVDADQVGEAIVCPDCDQLIEVQPPLPERAPDPSDEDVGEYGVSEPNIASRPVSSMAGLRRQSKPGASCVEDRFTAPHRPPRRPLLLGVFNFPWYANCWHRWLVLCGSGIVVSLLAYQAFSFANVESIFHWIISLALTGLTFAFGMMWTVTVLVHCIAIVEETSAGNDKIESWPDVLFLDWCGVCFFIVNSLAVTGLPGFVVAELSEYKGAMFMVPIGISWWLLFPFVFLSMLECNSRFAPFSPLVARSLFNAWTAWLGFWVEATLFVGAVGWLLWQARDLPPSLLTVLFPLVLSTVLMIYFRLLGRLAWCCDDAAAKAEPEDDDD